MSAAVGPEARDPKLRPIPAGLKPGYRSSLVADPLGAHAATASTARTIRVGIVGLGQVGQAVARLAPEAERLKSSGLRFRVLGALVRDIERPRRCPRPSRLTTNPAAFLRGNYDVVIEALGTVEPARGIVARLLGRSIPVVSANKALIAAHGAELAALAARRGTSLRYEASALAGVPFLGSLASRPLVSDVRRFVAVVNGTSNFILSKLETDQCAFDQALAAAQALGLTEPDPSRDLDGLDAADKVSLLATLFGWGSISSDAMDVQGIRDITPQDLSVAHTLGSTIKPLVWAARSGSALEAFIGPALVPARHPLGALNGTLSGIQFSGRYVSDLFFSGPGAGPDITAATILDDAVEAVSSAPRFARAAWKRPEALRLTAPATGWFVRARFPGLVPDASAAREAFNANGLSVRQVTDSIHDARWLLLDNATRDQLTRALAVLRDTHRL
ncbi:MAG: homoserine dehydrogenase, partial [Vicinamibacterales bacterium]